MNNSSFATLSKQSWNETLGYVNLSYRLKVIYDIRSGYLIYSVGVLVLGCCMLRQNQEKPQFPQNMT